MFTADSFSISPYNIQTLLGYDVDVYSNCINIITDTRDLIDSGSTLKVNSPLELNNYTDVTLTTEDTSKPIKPQEESSSSSDTLEPTHEPTSEPTTGESSSSSSNSNTSSSKPTSQPTSSSSSSSSSSTGGTSSSSTSQPTGTIRTKYFNPDSPGYTPGTYSTDDKGLLQYIDKLPSKTVTTTKSYAPEGNEIHLA